MFELSMKLDVSFLFEDIRAQETEDENNDQMLALTFYLLYLQVFPEENLLKYMEK